MNQLQCTIDAVEQKSGVISSKSNLQSTAMVVLDDLNSTCTYGKHCSRPPNVAKLNKVVQCDNHPPDDAFWHHSILVSKRQIVVAVP